jgi:hypothetical protein
MRKTTFANVFILLLPLLTMLPGMAQSLRVSDNKRYLVKADGTPFFYLGDTAWELFHRLNREEAERYLRRRAEQGFTVIQAVVLAELDGLHAPNPYGNTPLQNDDPTKPNEAYFKHVDWVVSKAAEVGLHIGMLPTWGDKIFKNQWGMGPEIFTPENARTYGRYLGNRYKNAHNIIWVMGGDRNPRNEADQQIWRSLAEGVTEGVGGKDKVLVTFHPQPQEQGSSSTWFHQDEWLDFNMFQNGHCRDVPVWDRISRDYNLTPTKPAMDGEPLYEDHPICFNAAENGFSLPYDVRRFAYLELFAGAHGHTYGCHSIWQMWGPKRKGVNSPLRYWYESLDLPGANHMTHVRNLIESRPMLVRVPDQALVGGEGATTKSALQRVQATRGEDYAFVYSAGGLPFTVNMGKISGKQVKAHWFDPRTGGAKAIGSFNNSGTQTFTPPFSGFDQDWVLVLDDASKNYGLPGVGKAGR